MKSYLLPLALLLPLLTGSCKNTAESHSPAVTYTVTEPHMTDTYVAKDYVAHLQSLKNIEVRTQTEGVLQHIYVDEGCYVKAGQPLFSIAPERFRIAAEKAEADLEQARIDYRNTTLLAKNKVVASTQQTQAEAKMRSAAADLKLARLQLRYATIRAPFSGVVGALPKKAGTLLSEGDLLTTLSDNSSILAYFNLSEPEYLDYMTRKESKQNTPLKLILANGQPFSHPGTLTAVAGEFNSETGAIALRARFPNPQGLLRNGETGTVRIAQPLHHVAIIPQCATYEVQDHRYVFVVDKGGIVHSRLITVAYEQPDVYILGSGLRPGEHFLVTGVQKVKDGDRLKLRYEAPEKVMRSLHLSAN